MSTFLSKYCNIKIGDDYLKSPTYIVEYVYCHVFNVVAIYCNHYYSKNPLQTLERYLCRHTVVNKYSYLYFPIERNGKKCF